MHAEHMHNINICEADYAQCRKLLAEDGNVCSGDGLFSKLARNVSDAGDVRSPDDQFAIENAAFDVFLCLGLWDRIDQAAKEVVAHSAAAWLRE
jgi:hypothetical protein